MSCTRGELRQVVVLNHFARPRSVAAGTRHVELFSRLDGWQAAIIVGDRGLKGGDWRGREGIVESVRTIAYSTNGGGRVLNWVSYAVSAFARGIRIRPVHLVYGSSPHLLAPVAGLLIARLRRVPFILEVRDLWPQVLVDMGTLRPESATCRALEWLAQQLYRRAERIVVLAAGTRDRLVAAQVDPAKIVFIPNAADASDFVVEATRPELRARYGFDGVVAVYAGAHGPANGLGLLLDAADALQHTPDLTIVLVGDGVEKARLVARAQREMIRNVVFMDPIPKSEMPALLAASDIGIHCLADVALFRDAVSPNKLFDYMAAGVPVVTNTPGEVASFVRESGGGVAVEPTGLAAGLATLAALTPHDREQMGRAGQRHVMHTRSRTAMAQRLQGLLMSSVERAAPPS
jgi:glycosyltransferase involved in cell wall biosynthesis